MNKQDITKYIKENYNIKVMSLETMVKGVSDSYILTALSAKYILKFIAKSFEPTVVNSLEILRYLEQHNYPSPKVVRTLKKEMFLTYLNGSIAVLYHYTDGTDLDENIDYTKLGQTVGKLHTLMDNYKATLKTQDKDYFINRYIKILHQKRYPTEKINAYYKLGNLLWDKVKHLPLSYCHGDLHKGNIIKDLKGNYQLLDFDTSCLGYSIHDIMLICNSTNYFYFKEDAFELTTSNFEQFIEGYEQFKILSKDQKTSFYYFMGMYHFQLQATIIEIHGINCIDHHFIDKQFEWLKQWQIKCETSLNISF